MTSLTAAQEDESIGVTINVLSDARVLENHEIMDDDGENGRALAIINGHSSRYAIHLRGKDLSRRRLLK